MADLIAIIVLGLQYSLIISIVDLYLPVHLPFGLALVVFLALASLGTAFWHRKKFSRTKQWGRYTMWSVLLGLTFFGADLLLAYLHGQPNPIHFSGGLLGLPLTFLVCPGGTMVCVAGLVRAFYVDSRSGSAE